MSGCVYLVGAGCGAYDLITLRGMECLRRADAVVYDDLLDEELLEFAPSQAQRHYVGKRSGRHSMKQPQINQLLIGLAREGKTVCRLTGGDPFVFGRGGEEMLALGRAGVACEEIPGITSAIAVPAAAGIPVTHRELGRSFHVITAHTSNTPDGLPEDLETLAGLGGTLIFLMGLGSLRPLAERLMEAGLAGDTPAAVVGSQTFRGPLARIAGLAREASPPAVILVGGTAGMDLRAAPSGGLCGATVGLTGTARFRQGLFEALARCGASPVTLQKSRVEAACTPEELIEALAWAPNWAAFTSPNGVSRFFALLARARWDVRRLANLRFAAVGPGTAAELERNGILADLVPSRHDTAALGEALAQACNGGRVLLAGAEHPSPAPALALEQAGIAHRRLSLYRLACGGVEKRAVDYVAFGSASGVRNYFDAGGQAPLRAAVCIGQSTAQQARLLGCSRVLAAADATPRAVARAAIQDWEARQ